MSNSQFDLLISVSVSIAIFLFICYWLHIFLKEADQVRERISHVNTNQSKNGIDYSLDLSVPIHRIHHINPLYPFNEIFDSSLSNPGNPSSPLFELDD